MKIRIDRGDWKPLWDNLKVAEENGHIKGLEWSELYYRSSIKFKVPADNTEERYLHKLKIHILENFEASIPTNFRVLYDTQERTMEISIYGENPNAI